MQQNESKTLTQDELVAELHDLGFSGVTARRVAAWRKHDLLPPFDRIGGGRGRSRGRESSAWMLGEAASVHELLKIYKGFDDLYLPLLMLGYRVPLTVTSTFSVRDLLPRVIAHAGHTLPGCTGGATTRSVFRIRKINFKTSENRSRKWDTHQSEGIANHSVARTYAICAN